MSRNIEEVNGEYVTALDNKDECKHMYNGVCCNDNSEHLADFVSKELGFWCDKCQLFEKEDMK